jgi:hypothetical protein
VPTPGWATLTALWQTATERPHQVTALGAAHSGHVGAERLGELHREAAHPTRGPNDHDLLPWLDPSGVAQRLEGGEPEMGTAAACSKVRLVGFNTS